MKCGLCKFWGEVGEAFSHRTCTAVVHDKNMEYRKEEFFVPDCDDEDELIKAREFMSGHRAIACDGSGYYAALKTSDDFGCVLFEERKDLSCGN